MRSLEIRQLQITAIKVSIFISKMLKNSPTRHEHQFQFFFRELCPRAPIRGGEEGKGKEGGEGLRHGCWGDGRPCKYYFLQTVQRIF